MTDLAPFMAVFLLAARYDRQLSELKTKIAVLQAERSAAPSPMPK